MRLKTCIKKIQKSIQRSDVKQIWMFGSSLFFPSQVNKDNVVKVGHKQVVNMIRHGGNHLIIKVVTVSRNLDPDDTARKKGTGLVSYLRSLTDQSWFFLLTLQKLLRWY